MLEVSNVSIRFGGVKALSDVSFNVEQGQVFSIIGPNGAGKTSMLNCISGRYRPSAGQLLYKGQPLSSCSINDRARLGIGRTFQNLALFSHMSVLDNIMVGRHLLMRNNFVTGMLYWVGGAQREEQASLGRRVPAGQGRQLGVESLKFQIDAERGIVLLEEPPGISQRLPSLGGHDGHHLITPANA
jgi:ABC-type branched-subunit amino acid transport system ATPase component